MLGRIGQIPVMAIGIGTVNGRKGQWLPSHIVLPDAFRSKHPRFAMPGSMYTGMAIFVFHGEVAQATYLLQDALFAAVVDLTNTGNAIGGLIHIPTLFQATRHVAFQDVVKVESNDPATWPVEIRNHVDIQRRYIASFRDELERRPSWVTLIVPESVRPVGYELICREPTNPVRVIVLKKLSQLWREVDVILTAIAAKLNAEAAEKRRLAEEEKELRRRQRDDSVAGC